MEQTRTLLIEAQLRIAHDKIMQAQQKIDNEDLQEQRLLEQALDAINSARISLTQWGQYTYMTSDRPKQKTGCELPVHSRSFVVCLWHCESHVR